MKRSVLALLLSLLLVCGYALPAGAETVVKDGIEVTLTTDKESYDSLDVIDARLTVRNTNGFGVENVSAHIAAPEGYTLSGDGEVKIGELSAGEVQIQQASVRDVEAGAPNLPQTGDDSNGMLWSLLLFVSAAVLCGLVIRNPQAKRMISLLLCVAMVDTMVLEAVPVVAAENGQDTNITISKKVTVDGKPVKLTAVVTYSENEEMIARSNATERVKISGYKINDAAENVKVREGDTLSFAGTITATDGAEISAVQVFVYEANTEVPYSVGEKYYAVTDVNAETFDLAEIPEMTVGEAFGESDYALTEKGRYVVMVYAGDTNDACFADSDPAADGDQGPAIALRVQMLQDTCDHSACEYDYELDDSTDSRAVANDDGVTHTVENSYRRYCADCGKYLMNVWGSGVSEEHSMVDGRCNECGYSPEAMLLGLDQGIPKITFYSGYSFVTPGKMQQIDWEAGYSDSYVVNVKLLDSEPSYSDLEAGTSIVLNQSQTDSFISFRVPDDAQAGKYIKVHVYGVTAGEQTEAGNQIYLKVYENERIAVCDHERAFASLSYVEYMLKDTEKHIAKEFYTTYCDECADSVNRIKTIEKEETHTFDEQGVCVDCAYKQGNPCEHDRTDTSITYIYDYKYDTETMASSADVHAVYEIHEMECLDCEVYLGVERKEYLESHEKNAAGKCVKCGYPSENDCSHPTIEIGNKIEDVQYKPCEDDARMHTKTYKGLSDVCELCGSVLGHYYVMESKNYHTYQDGKCKFCGYGETGEHEHKSDGGYVYLRDVIEEIPGDNVHHRVTAYVYETTCSICKEKYEVESPDGGKGRPAAPHDKDKHVFNDGVCGGCGYECAHTFETMTDAAGNPKAEPNSGVWTSQGATGHKCTSIKYWQKCTNCGLEETYEKANPYGDQVQAHMMNNVLKAHYDYDANEHWLIGEDRKCTAIGCGYEEFVQVDNAPHNSHQFSNGYCAVCGMADSNYSSGSNGNSSYGTGNTGNTGNPYINEPWYNTWKEIDKEKNRPTRLWDAEIDPEQDLYLFEIFLDEYQHDWGMMASVFTTEVVNATKTYASDAMEALTKWQIDSDSLWATFDYDKQVADVIINYLSTVDCSTMEDKIDTEPVSNSIVVSSWYEKLMSAFSAYYDDVRKGLSKDIALNKAHTDLMEKVEYESTYEAYKTFSESYLMRMDEIGDLRRFNTKDEALAEFVKSWSFIDEATGQQFTFGEAYYISADNVREITKKISAAKKGASSDGLIQFTIGAGDGIDPTLDYVMKTNLDESMDEWYDIIKKNTDKMLKEEQENANKGKEAGKAANIVKYGTWAIDAVISAVDGYTQIQVAETVLKEHEEYLRNVLAYSDCENAEEIIDEVISVLRDITINKMCEGWGNAANSAIGSLAGNIVQDKADDAAKSLIKNKILSGIGAKANPYLAAFDIGTSAAMLLSNASNTKLKVWQTEDIGRRFDQSKENLEEAINNFYYSPCDDTYEELVWTFEYYSLLVHSTSKQVSDILVADANSGRSMFTNWVSSMFSNSGVDQRIERIKDAEDIPEDDRDTWNRFRNRLGIQNPDSPLN